MNDPSLPANMREFQCIHCNGKIRIPKDLQPTTAPCPLCHGIITSPAPEPESPISHLPPAPVGYPTGQVPVIPAVAPLPAIGSPVTNIPPAPTATTPPEPQQPARVDAPPHAEVPSPVTQQVSSPDSPASTPTRPARKPSRNNEETPNPKKSLIAVLLITLLLLALAGGAGFMVFKEMRGRSLSGPTSKPGKPPMDNALAESQYLRVGWKKEAYAILDKFLAAKTADEKIPYIINGAELRPQLEAFYGGSQINDQDTPVDAFSVVELSEPDRKKGIFMLSFDQPPQFEMKEFFRPLATLEIQFGLNEADLLFTSMARLENFASEPIRVSALFKRTPDGLKLDWETYAQTKYKTFVNFVELPEPGQAGVFRVILSEDVPESGRTLSPGVKTYRVWDPSAPESSTRVNVNIDSEIGKELSKIDWRGKQNRPINSTATIELKWVGSDHPQLEIARFICWEFLHLGGTENSSVPR